MFAFALLAAVSLAGAQDDFPKTAENRWAYDAVALAMREKILYAYPDDGYLGFRRGRSPSRYEVAVVLHATATNHLERLESFLKRPMNEIERATLLRSAVLMPAYRKAEKTFKREYVSLGVSDDFGQSRIAALTLKLQGMGDPSRRPFRDVPANHWAAKAVGDMHALGLLDGYPDGRFHG